MVSKPNSVNLGRIAPASPFQKTVRVLVLSVLPVLMTVTGVQIKRAGGQFWQGNIDPGYHYLMDGLNVANLHRPRQAEHPGTPVQVYTGAMIRLLNLFSNEQETATRVITDPEFYLTFTNHTLIALYALCMLAVGCIALSVTNNLVLSMLSQATPFLSLTLLLGLVGIRPEIFFLCISMLLSGVILLTFKFDIAKYARRYAIAFGVLIGIGIAAKVPFAPMVILPLLLLPSWKWKLHFALATIVSFLISIAPIITPAQLRTLSHFVLATATHTGTYGYGAKGIVDADNYLSNLRSLIRGDVLSFFFIFGGLLPLILKSKIPQLGYAKFKALLAVTVSQFCLLFVVAKHPNARYLIPGLGLVGINFMLLLEVACHKLAAINPRFYYVPLILVCSVIFFKRTYSLIGLYGSLEKGVREIEVINEKLEKESREATVVHYYGASSLVYGLKFGSEYSGNVYVPLLAKTYPNACFYNLWKLEFSNFAGPVDISQIQGQKNWWIMHGFSLNEPKFRAQLPEKVLPDDIRLDDIYMGNIDDPKVWNGETIYKAFKVSK